MRIIETYRKHLLILLDVLLMEYILKEVGEEIVKPEYVYVIYLPLPGDADRVRCGFRQGIHTADKIYR